MKNTHMHWLVVYILIMSMKTLANHHAHAASAHIDEETVLDVQIESFSVKDVTMFEALELLRSKNPSRILMGFEEVPTPRGNGLRSCGQTASMTRVTTTPF